MAPSTTRMGITALLAILLVAGTADASGQRKLHQATEESIVSVAQATPELSTLVDLVVLAGLDGTLSNSSLVATVFAPTNAAINASLAALGLTVQEFTANVTFVQEILSYHVVPGVAALSTDLTDGQVLPTLLAGQNLTVNITGSTVQIVPTGGVAATVTMADVPAGEAVVHLIDFVLVPGSGTPEEDGSEEDGTATAPVAAPAPAPGNGVGAKHAVAAPLLLSGVAVLAGLAL